MIKYRFAIKAFFISVTVVFGSIFSYSTTINAAEIRPIRPYLECIVTLEDGLYRAWFGYTNENDFPLSAIISRFSISGILGETMTPPQFFEAGTVTFAFSTLFDGSSIVWSVTGADGTTRTVTASSLSRECVFEEEVIDPVDDQDDPSEPEDDANEDDNVLGEDDNHESDEELEDDEPIPATRDSAIHQLSLILMLVGFILVLFSISLKGQRQ